MNKKKMPLPLKILIIAAASINVATVVFTAFLGYNFIKFVKFESDTESTEMHVIKTLPDFSDYDMWVFGFQDLTVYGKYYFDKNITEIELEDSGYFKKVTDDNLLHIRNAVTNFEHDVESTKGNGGLLGDDISEVYDFDKAELDSDGWWYYLETIVDTEEYQSFDPEEAEHHYSSFNYYLYSEKDRIVYIMHNNT